MTIEVSKRTGANLIETVDGVKQVVDADAEDAGRKACRSPSRRTSRS